MLDPEYRGLFLEKVQRYGAQGWQEVFNRVVSLLLLESGLQHQSLTSPVRRWCNSVPII